MGELVKRALDAFLLFDDDTPPSQRRWRLAVTLMMLLFTVHIAIACNLLTFVGLHGFALADDLSATQVAIQQVRVQQLETAIFEARVKQCAAIKVGQPVTAYSQHLQDLLTTYVQLTKQNYPLPACTEL